MLSDFGPTELPREIMKAYGVDVLPKNFKGMSNENKRSTNIPLETSLIHSRVSR